MRTLNKLGLTGALFALLAAAAGAETLYRWTNADGVVAYSDELKRIPEAFRASAVKVQTGSLRGYKHYTPAERQAATAAREKQGAERLERLRELNEAPRAPAGASAGGASFPAAAVQVNRRLSMAIPTDRLASDEPIVVEEQRVRTGDTTTHIYVVRQGDRILSVLRPHTNHSDANWPTEEQLLGEE